MLEGVMKHDADGMEDSMPPVIKPGVCIRGIVTSRIRSYKISRVNDIDSIWKIDSIRN